MPAKCAKCGHNMCNCGQCACPSCGLDPKKPKPEKIVVTAKTQKAMGLQALTSLHYNVPPFKVYNAQEIARVGAFNRFVGKFVRPCPMRPRHGFVDSRLIKTLQDAELIVEETLRQDPDAEFVVMDELPAVYSGIWTEGILAIGKGNDGATAGTSAHTIPVLGDLLIDQLGYRDGTSQLLRERANIKGAPYVELIYTDAEERDRITPLGHDYKVWEVQLRDGPKLESQSEDYIPSEYTVENVVLAEGDLLAWESKMKAMPKGTVVYHPNGSLASHYAIHAVINNIPVMISREPKVGEVIKPTADATKNVDIDELRAGFQWATITPMSAEQAGSLMLAGTHNMVIWKGKYDFLIGAAMGAAWRLTVTAALGEHRHAPIVKSNGETHTRRRKLDRNIVYDRAWDGTAKPVIRRKFMGALDGFVKLPWEGNMGGTNWFKFADWARMLHNALLQGDSNQAMAILNTLVNEAHNTGWAFNKFLAERDLDLAAKAPVTVTHRAGPVIYEALSLSTDDKIRMSRSFMKYRRSLNEVASPVIYDVQVKQPEQAKTSDIGFWKNNPITELEIQFKVNLLSDKAVQTRIIPLKEKKIKSGSFQENLYFNLRGRLYPSLFDAKGKSEYVKATKHGKTGYYMAELELLPVFYNELPEENQ